MADERLETASVCCLHGFPSNIEHAFEEVTDELFDQRFFGGESTIERAHSHPGRMGDLLDWSVEAMDGEDIGGRFKDASTILDGVATQRPVAFNALRLSGRTPSARRPGTATWHR